MYPIIVSCLYRRDLGLGPELQPSAVIKCKQLLFHEPLIHSHVYVYVFQRTSYITFTLHVYDVIIISGGGGDVGGGKGKLEECQASCCSLRLVFQICRREPTGYFYVCGDQKKTKNDLSLNQPTNRIFYLNLTRAEAQRCHSIQLKIELK